MTPLALLGFTGLCLLLAITPGPDTFLVLRYGLGGTRFGVLAAVGSAIGSLFWAAAVALGLANLLSGSPPALLTVKIVGGAYLIYLGVTGFRRYEDTRDHDDVGRGLRWTAGLALRSGMFSCALNPKVGLFFLAIVPQFLSSDTVRFGAIMLLGMIDAAVALTWLTLVAAGAGKAAAWLRRPNVSHTMARLSSAALAVLGIGTLATAAVR
jgi:threonine/homoserine/homoserine lactone efflux protein